MAHDPLTIFHHIGGFSARDMDDLAAIAPLLRDKTPAINEAFYARLLSHPAVAVHIEGKLERLKETHRAWLDDLLGGVCDEAFWARQRQIGRVHVQAKIPPLFVSASMSFLRAELPRAVAGCASSVHGETVQRGLSALLRLLDICQMLIDKAYEDERLNRLSDATGMRPALIENLIDLRAS
ncbi:MAG: protoglobin domain-containing protein [Pseudomonadota bacterium]